MNRRKRQREIAQRLRRALLQEGRMVYALYEHELAEHVDYWYEGLKADREAFVFVVTENAGDVAMVLIEPDKTVYVNEEARERLRAHWSEMYWENVEQLIPLMAEELANDILAVNGVRIVH
jgi:hypothetical protein